MSRVLWDQIRRRMDEHAYMAGVPRAAERVRATGEVFTPTGLVLDMIVRLPLTRFAPGQTVLDPACGDGQVLVAAKWVKVLHHAMSEEDALAEIYGIDIMRDNVDLCLRRLGGGTVVMGDALCPDRRLPGQTEEEHHLMRQLFSGAHTQEAFAV